MLPLLTTGKRLWRDKTHLFWTRLQLNNWQKCLRLNKPQWRICYRHHAGSCLKTRLGSVTVNFFDIAPTVDNPCCTPWRSFYFQTFHSVVYFGTFNSSSCSSLSIIGCIWFLIHIHPCVPGNTASQITFSKPLAKARNSSPRLITVPIWLSPLLENELSASSRWY